MRANTATALAAPDRSTRSEPPSLTFVEGGRTRCLSALRAQLAVVTGRLSDVAAGSSRAAEFANEALSGALATLRHGVLGGHQHHAAGGAAAAHPSPTRRRKSARRLAKHLNEVMQRVTEMRTNLQRCKDKRKSVRVRSPVVRVAQRTTWCP